jgi:hypothetical protein
VSSLNFFLLERILCLHKRWIIHDFSKSWIGLFRKTHEMKLTITLLLGIGIGMGIGVFGLAPMFVDRDRKPESAAKPEVARPVVARGGDVVVNPAGGPGTETPSKEMKGATPPQPPKMTPEEAKKLIADFAAENKDLNSRAAFAEGVLRKLCEDGYSREAWGLIDAGNGIVRNFGLSTFFRNADLPPSELLEKIASVPTLDMYTCFSGFLNRYPPDQLSTLLGSPEVDRFLSAVDRKYVSVNASVSSVLLGAFNKMPPEERGETYQIARDLNSKGLLEPHDFILMTQRYSNKNIFDQWEDIRTVNLTAWDSDVVRKQRYSMLSAMVTEDAPAAVKTILNNDGEQAGKDMTLALQSWTNLDSQGAADWYKSNQASFSGKQRELVSSSFAEAAISSLEFDSARLWAEQIQDPETRDRTLETVKQKKLEYEQKSLSK